MNNESQTGNPLYLSHFATNTAHETDSFLETTVTASYTRDGDQVSIKITVTGINWAGKYAQLSIDNVSNGGLIDMLKNDSDSSDHHEYIYSPKTFTYTQVGSKTYTFTLRTFVQYATNWKGYTYFDYLTITVPAATSKLWCVGTDGKWHAAKIYYSTGSAWKNAELYDTNHIPT